MKNFFDPNDEKITEKAFTHGLIISILSIVLCLVALCSITFAWFNGGVESGNNKLESGRYDILVAVNDENGNVIIVNEDDNGVWMCSLENGKTYTVSISMTDDTTVTKGYCVVTIDGKTYSTSAISNDSAIGNEPLEFTVKANRSDISITFAPSWGLPVNVQGNISADQTLTVGETDTSVTAETEVESSSETELSTDTEPAP